MTDEALAEAGINALADFIREIGLPTSLKELGVTEDIDLREIADSCNLSVGSYKKMTHEEILEIFRNVYKSGVSEMHRKKEMLFCGDFSNLFLYSVCLQRYRCRQ